MAVFILYCETSCIRILTDSDECELSPDSCPASLDCVNTVGSYRCLARCTKGHRRNVISLHCEGQFVVVSVHAGTSMLICAAFRLVGFICHVGFNSYTIQNLTQK